MCLEGGGEVDKVGPLTDNLAHTRISQSGPIGPHDQLAPEPPADNTPYNDANKSGPVPKYPDQPDQAQPASYKEKISAATSSIATTVVSAKDAIAEKLGYGHKDDQHSSGEGKPASSPGEHGQKMKETLAPVYVKITEVASAVASKMSGGSKTGESQGQAGDKVRVEETEGGVKKVRSGGQTVPEYLTDKLGSGGEDRPLSEVVLDVLHKRKDVQDEVTVDESGHRHEKCEGCSGSGEGGGVVDVIIGAVASYFNTGGEASDAYGTHISGGPQESSHENRNRHKQRISESAN